jgi:asparagine synthase (glutamine-hydrolysing)
VRYFVCLLDTGESGIPGEVRRGCESLARARGLKSRWHSAMAAEVLVVSDEVLDDSLVEQDGDSLAVGMVRLDNRAALEGLAGADAGSLSDLALVHRLITLHGSRYIADLLGDFGFVVWNGRDRTGVAACDSFAVERLYHSVPKNLLAFASRAEALAIEELYECEYLLRLMTLQWPSPGLSVYSGVRSVPAGSMICFARGAVSVSNYWHPKDFEADTAGPTSEQEAADTCRHLLTDSIRQRLGARGETWAQLSGGLDSSAVVSLTQWLAERGDIPHGLAGTVTHVDRQFTGSDERRYSTVVAERWGLRNVLIVDPPAWHDPECTCLPFVDQPRLDVPFHPRDCRTSAAVKGNGGKVLLTGWGGDELFMGTMLFFADWLAKGWVRSAVREMCRRAAIGRVSLWELMYRNAILPLLPRVAQARLVRNKEDAQFQSWVRTDAMRRYGVALQSSTLEDYAGALGKKYQHAVATKIATLPVVTAHGVLTDRLSVRHPMLYRPLVEFAIRLPANIRARPHAHRWVLRQALSGILPDVVRTRVGKSDTGGVLAWSLGSDSGRTTELLRRPILADLGLIEPRKLRAEYARALTSTRRGEYAHVPLLATLAVEAWLQMRIGRWPCGGRLSGS